MKKPQIRDRAPPFDENPMSIPGVATQVRCSHGTHRYLFTVASSRTWRGSQACAAWDPAISIASPGSGSTGLAYGGNYTPL